MGSASAVLSVTKTLDEELHRFMNRQSEEDNILKFDPGRAL